MSDRSNDILWNGAPTFYWELSKLPGGRYKAQAVSYPEIHGVGASEQEAIYEADKRAREALETGEI